jgi:hypothetical protein
MKRPVALRWLLALVPVLLIALVWIGIRWWRDDPAREALQAGTTYEIWLSEAEVKPQKADGGRWDADGSAPDLRGVIVWQDQRILETVTADNGLIAQWEPVAVKLSQVLHGEADTASVRRVGRVRPDAGGHVEIGVFDDDATHPDPAGVFRVPWSALKPGVNEILTVGPVLRLRVVVAEPGGESAKPAFHRVSGVTELKEVPPAMAGMVSGAAREATDAATKAAGELGDKAGKAADAVKKWFQPEPEK